MANSDSEKKTATENSDFYLSKYVGEDKKYKTVEDLAKAYEHADGFIKHLENHTEELKTELEKRMSLETFLKTETKPAEENGNVTPKPEDKPEDTPSRSAPEPKEAVDTSDLIERIKAELKAEDEKSKAESNINSVADKLMATYGNEEAVNKAVADKAAELGVSVKWMQDAASQSPAGFYGLMGIKDDQKAKPNLDSSKNTAAFETTSSDRSSEPEPGTKAFYDNLRKEDFKKYMSREVQLKIYKDAMENPDKFYGKS